MSNKLFCNGIGGKFMKTKTNKGIVIAAVSAVTLASVATIAGICTKALKKSLIKELNDSDFENFNGYGKCSSTCCGKDDSYDDVLRHRKNRYYQKVGMY